MKTMILLFISFFAFSLFAEESLQIKVKELSKLQEKEKIQTQENIQQNYTKDSTYDIFVDRDGDGIADNRNFQERHRNWRRNSQLSGKVFRSGSCQEWKKGQGDYGTPGNSGGQCSGNGGGNRG